MDSTQDTARALGDLIRWGRIIEVQGRKARVQVGEIETGFILVQAGAAGATSSWRKPTIGEQVMLICPDAQIEGAAAIGGFYSDAHPAPGDDDIEVLRAFPDGGRITFDPDTHELRVALPAGGKVVLVADAGVEIQGDLTVQGRIEATEDVVVGDITLTGHHHTEQGDGAPVSAPTP